MISLKEILENSFVSDRASLMAVSLIERKT